MKLKRGLARALSRLAGGVLAVAGVSAPAAAQQTPIAPSQVTPRTLLPPPPPLPPPLSIPRSLPAEAPPGSEKVMLTVPRIVVDGAYPEMERATRAILAPLEGRTVSVGELYKGAAALEAAYVRAGYFLVRIVVPEQRVTPGEPFRLALVDGFVESLQDSALPWQIRAPVRRTMIGIVGKRKPKLADLDARLAEAGAVPGAKVRSTLGQGETPGGARLILDGGFAPFGLNIGADNRLGPSFNNWGLNISGQINSPTGNGEQIYGFLSVQPRLDEAFGKNARRRVGGGGITLPLVGTGLTLNPEFTISDTKPKVANPIFASDGRLYRGSLSLLAPVRFVPVGTASAKASIIFTRETQSLPFFGVALSQDRLTVLQGALSWNVQAWATGRISTNLILSQGIKALGARTPATIAASSTPSSRGSDPQFTSVEGRGEIDQPLAAGFAIALIGRAQTSFGSVVPNAYSFDLTGFDGLSSFTAGGLSADGGAVIRSELSRPLQAGAGRLRLIATPYVYGAIGRAFYAVSDPLNPRTGTSYGAGVHLNGDGFPLGAGLSASLEYGHSHLDRGNPPDDRLSVSFGVQF